MKDLIKILTLTFISILICSSTYGQIKKEEARSNKFSSGFDKKESTNPPQQFAPPPPDWEAPISGGMWMLIAGSIVYWVRRTKQNLSNE